MDYPSRYDEIDPAVLGRMKPFLEQDRRELWLFLQFQMHGGPNVPLTAAARRAWARARQLPPPAPRWDALNEEDRRDPLCLALMGKKRRLARELLDRETVLTPDEAARYAPLTFHWAPDLLARILDLAPAGVYLDGYRFPPRSGPERKCLLSGSLLLAAAAADDLVSLELLLAREEYLPLSFSGRRALARRYVEHGNRGPLSATLCLQSAGAPAEEAPSSQFPQVTQPTDPLAAAILCGAVSCARRLAAHPRFPLTAAARQAAAQFLLLPSLCRDPRWARSRQAARAAADVLGVPPEELLRPEEIPWPVYDRPLYRAALRRRPSLPERAVCEMVTLLRSTNPYAEHWKEPVRACLALLPPEQAAAGVLACLQSSGGELPPRTTWQTACRWVLDLAKELQLPLLRCRVHPMASWEKLRSLLEAFGPPDPPPEGGVSGLGWALLRCAGGDDRPQVLRHPAAIAALQGEDPALLPALAEELELPRMEPILALAGPGKEDDPYVL